MNRITRHEANSGIRTEGPPLPNRALIANDQRRAGFGAPFWLLLTYFFFEYVRPQERFPVLGLLRPGLILVVLLAIFWLAKGDKTVLKEPLIVLYVLFIILVGSTVVFARNTFWVFQMTKTLTLYLPAILALTTLVTSRQTIVRFFNVWLIIHVLIALQSIEQGGRGPGSFLTDENDFSLALNMAIPYAYFLAQAQQNSQFRKLAYLAALTVLVLATVLTQSRGGFLGLAAATVGLLFFSRHRIRNLFTLAALGLVVSLWMPSSYIDEMKTVTDAQDSTRQERLYSWRRSMEMFRDNPVLGVGAGNWPWKINEYELASSEYDPDAQRLLGGRVAHSLYFTLIPELGLVGILIYTAIVILIFRRLISVSRAQILKNTISAERSDHLQLLSRAMIVSLFAFLISGAFISVLYYPHLWYLIGFSLALERTAEASLPDKDPGGKSPSVKPGSAGVPMSRHS